LAPESDSESESESESESQTETESLFGIQVRQKVGVKGRQIFIKNSGENSCNCSFGGLEC